MNKDFHDCIITHDISCMIYMYMRVIYFPVHVDLPDLKYMYMDTLYRYVYIHLILDKLPGMTSLTSPPGPAPCWVPVGGRYSVCSLHYPDRQQRSHCREKSLSFPAPPCIGKHVLIFISRTIYLKVNICIHVHCMCEWASASRWACPCMYRTLQRPWWWRS